MFVKKKNVENKDFKIAWKTEIMPNSHKGL